MSKNKLLYSTKTADRHIANVPFVFAALFYSLFFREFQVHVHVHRNRIMYLCVNTKFKFTLSLCHATFKLEMSRYYPSRFTNRNLSEK